MEATPRKRRCVATSCANPQGTQQGKKAADSDAEETWHLNESSKRLPKSLFSPTHKPFREFCKHSTQVVVRPMLGIQNWYRSAWCENITSHLPTKFVFLGAVDESRMVFIDFLDSSP